MQNENKIKESDKKVAKKPDEAGSIAVTSHLKIFDPNTKQEFINKRDS